MRRTVVALSALATVLLGAVPAASADSDTGAGAGKGWEPTPSQPWDVPAGLGATSPFTVNPSSMR